MQRNKNFHNTQFVTENGITKGRTENRGKGGRAGSGCWKQKLEQKLLPTARSSTNSRLPRHPTHRREGRHVGPGGALHFLRSRVLIFFFEHPCSIQMLRERVLAFVRQAAFPQLCEALGPDHLRNAAEGICGALRSWAAAADGKPLWPPRSCSSRQPLSDCQGQRKSQRKGKGKGKNKMAKAIISSRPLDVALPDVLFYLVCQFLPWDDLLLQVRLVSRGFLHRISNPLCWPWLRLREENPRRGLRQLFKVSSAPGGMWSHLVGLACVSALLVGSRLTLPTCPGCRI